MLRWVQWMVNKKQAGRIHITANGMVTLCNRQIIGPLTLDDKVPPRNTRAVCAFCDQAEEEGRLYRDG